MEILTLRARCRAPTQIGHDTSLWGSSQVSTSWMSSLEIITTLKRPTLLNNSRGESELDREETTFPLSYTSSAHEVGTWWCWSCWSCQLRTQFRGRDCDVTQIKVRQCLTDFFSYLTFILWLWLSDKTDQKEVKSFSIFVFSRLFKRVILLTLLQVVLISRFSIEYHSHLFIIFCMMRVKEKKIPNFCC